VEVSTFIGSFVEYVETVDLTTGLLKATSYGAVIGIASCWFGLETKGGAEGVGKAVNRSVVVAAVGILICDYVITLCVR